MYLQIHHMMHLVNKKNTIIATQYRIQVLLCKKYIKSFKIKRKRDFNK